MPQNYLNLTDVEKMMVGIAYSDSKKIGEDLAAALESGNLKIPENETIKIIVDKFFEYDFPAYQKVLAKFGSTQFGVSGKLACAGGGVAIGGILV